MTDSQVQPGDFHAPSVEELQDLFPKLEILELIACGGMGAVYKTRQPQLDRFAALKILPPAAGKDPEYAERFRREARAMAQLNHPGMVGIYDFGQAGEYFFLLMEHVDGFTLHEMIRGGTLEKSRMFSVFAQVCEGLAYAHEKGVVHLDIKPGNIMLDRNGYAKILDFGLASLRKGTEIDGAKEDMGTPDYAAPERYGTGGTVDHRADIYSLGVVLYEMLIGDVPGKAYFDVSAQTDVDPAIDKVIETCLAADPQRRYADVEQLARAVAEVEHSERAGSGRKKKKASVAPPARDLAAEKRRQAAGGSIRKWLFLLVAVPLLVAAGVYVLKDKVELEVRKKGAAGETSGAAGEDKMPGEQQDGNLPAGVAVASGDGEQTNLSGQGEGPPASEKTFTNGIGMSMIWVSPGSFRMGDLSGQRPNEMPVREIRLSGYYLAATEITAEKWRAVMGGKPVDAQEAQYPRDRVDWKSAMDFCEQLTRMEDSAGRLPAGYLYALPTEAQWEYACRAGTEGDFAGDLEALAWYEDNSDGGTHPVAGKQPNAWGFFDMHGNLSEWCWDRYTESYPEDLIEDPYGPNLGRLRVLRGGSWKSEKGRCRSASRTANSKNFLGEDVGFRVCLIRLNTVPKKLAERFFGEAEWEEEESREEQREPVPITGQEASEADDVKADPPSVVENKPPENDDRVDEATLEVPKITIKPVVRLVGHEGAVQAVGVSPNAPFVVTGGADATIRIWQSVTGVLLQTLVSSGPVGSISFSSDGRFIAVAGEASPEISIWSMENRQVIRKTGAGTGKGIRDVVFLPDGRSVAALHVFEDGQTDTAVIVWDLSTRKIKWRFDVQAPGMDGIAFVESVPGFVVYSLRRGAFFVPVSEQEILWQRDDLRGAVSVSADGRMVFVGNQALLVDGGADAHESVRIRDKGAVIVSDTGTAEYYAVGLENGRVVLRDAGNGAAITAQDAHDGACRAVAFYPRNEGLITGGADGSAAIWAIIE
jgi:formylglycine-generating enzyme required for sulfatase activity